MEKLYASIALTLFSGTIYFRYRVDLGLSAFTVWMMVFFGVVFLHFILSWFFHRIDRLTSQESGWKLAHLNFFDDSIRDEAAANEQELSKQDKSRPTLGW